MRFTISSWDTYRIVREISFLENSHLNQVYYHNGELKLRFSVPKDHLPEVFHGGGEGRYSRVDMLFRLPGALFLLPPSLTPPSPPPPAFAMALRKQISGSKVEGVEQVSGDRIVKIRLKKGDEVRDLIVELFSRGNVILVKNGIIERLLRREEFSSRTLAPSVPYTPPPNPYPLGRLISQGVPEDLEGLNSDRAVAAVLIRELSLPPPIAREVLKRTGVDERTPGRKAKEMWGEIKRELEGVLREFQEGERCYSYHLDEEIVISPVRLTHLNGDEKVHPSYLEALIEVYRAVSGSEENKLAEVKGDEGRLERRLRMQEEALQKLLQEIEGLRAKAECVYRHWGELESVIRAYRDSGGDLRAFSESAGVNVRMKDPVEKIALVRLQDEELGEVEIEVPLMGSVNDAAQRYYEMIKANQRKLEGLKGAIEETKKLMDRGEGVGKTKGGVYRPRRKFWFDPLRWFITSRGRLVVAGRDAKSNERVVKRYLKDEDLYFHADVQGASSVILKTGGESVGEEEIREAAQFAVVNSKAWRAGHGVGRAFWVRPEQVSKTPPSGEFLPKGSFMIRGKKNFVDHLPVRCAAGPVEIEGEKRFMCGPEEAVKAHSPWYVVIEPGDIKRGKVVGTLSRISCLPPDLIDTQLPLGDLRIVKISGLGEEKRRVLLRELGLEEP